jgi:hypothetical protein
MILAQLLQQAMGGNARRNIRSAGDRTSSRTSQARKGNATNYTRVGGSKLCDFFIHNLITYISLQFHY